MSNGYFKVEMPKNEPVKAYLPGSPERASLKKELERQSAQVVQVPMIIGGKEVWTERKTKAVMPHDHAHVIAEAASGGEKELKDAIAAALAARKAWTEMPMEHRVSIFLKAADLIAGPMRDKVNAATMLGQSKTAYQAEIDTCELIDFLRFNVYYLQQIYDRQPNNTPNVWNRIEYRPLEGFVTAISPFNFTSIGANLPTAPAIAGNVVLWKPATTAVLSNYYVMQALMAAGLPAGVINFVPSRGSDMSKYVLSDPNLAGFHFTGSTEVFSGVYSLVGENIKKNILTKGCILYSEVDFLLHQELRETPIYNSIIEAVALGNTKLNDISQKSLIEDTSKTSVYLKNLIELGIVEREFSVDAKIKEQANSSRGTYRLTENFFRFWYAFGFANFSQLEDGDVDGVYEFVVEPALHEFASFTFEDVCRAFVREMQKRNELPFRYAKMGRWTGKTTVRDEAALGGLRTAETEIDLLCIDRDAKNYMVGECKFKKAPFSYSEYLDTTAKLTPLKDKAEFYYALFSERGFDERIVADAKDNKTLLY